MADTRKAYAEMKEKIRMFWDEISHLDLERSGIKARLVKNVEDELWHCSGWHYSVSLNGIYLVKGWRVRPVWDGTLEAYFEEGWLRVS